MPCTFIREKKSQASKKKLPTLWHGGKKDSICRHRYMRRAGGNIRKKGAGFSAIERKVRIIEGDSRLPEFKGEKGGRCSLIRKNRRKRDRAERKKRGKVRRTEEGVALEGGDPSSHVYLQRRKLFAAQNGA